MDDDSSQLPEVIELFSDITLPIKVDRLMKVSHKGLEQVHLLVSLVYWQVSDSWRQKAAAASEPATKESQATEDSQQEKEGEGEEAGKEEGAVAASPGETGDTNKAKRATCEVCVYTS